MVDKFLGLVSGLLPPQVTIVLAAMVLVVSLWIAWAFLGESARAEVGRWVFRNWWFYLSLGATCAAVVPAVLLIPLPERGGSPAGSSGAPDRPEVTALATGPRKGDPPAPRPAGQENLLSWKALSPEVFQSFDDPKTLWSSWVLTQDDLPWFGEMAGGVYCLRNMKDANAIKYLHLDVEGKDLSDAPVSVEVRTESPSGTPFSGAGLLSTGSIAAHDGTTRTPCPPWGNSPSISELAPA